MDLLSHRARTGITFAATAGILAVCVGAMALGQDQIFTGKNCSKHNSPEFLAMAKASSVGESCRACHTRWGAPDAQCKACHTDPPPGGAKPIPAGSERSAYNLHDPTLIARDPHRRILKSPGTFGRQGRERAWLGHPRLPLACGSCHREHDEDRRPLKQVSNAVCEACHPRQHETPTSAHQRTGYLANSSPAAKRRFEQLQGGEVKSWSRNCVTCHFEHGNRTEPDSIKDNTSGEGDDNDIGEIKARE